MLSLNEICILKNELDTRFGVNLHFHDVCPTPFFTLEKSDEEAEKFIEEFLESKRLSPRFSEDGKQFVVVKKS